MVSLRVLREKGSATLAARHGPVNPDAACYRAGRNPQLDEISLHSSSHADRSASVASANGGGVDQDGRPTAGTHSSAIILSRGRCRTQPPSKALFAFASGLQPADHRLAPVGLSSILRFWRLRQNVQVSVSGSSALTQRHRGRTIRRLSTTSDRSRQSAHESAGAVTQLAVADL